MRAIGDEQPPGWATGEERYPGRRAQETPVISEAWAQETTGEDRYRGHGRAASGEKPYLWVYLGHW